MTVLLTLALVAAYISLAGFTGIVAKEIARECGIQGRLVGFSFITATWALLLALLLDITQ